MLPIQFLSRIASLFFWGGGVGLGRGEGVGWLFFSLQCFVCKATIRRKNTQIARSFICLFFFFFACCDCGEEESKYFLLFFFGIFIFSYVHSAFRTTLRHTPPRLPPHLPTSRLKKGERGERGKRGGWEERWRGLQRGGWILPKHRSEGVGYRGGGGGWVGGGGGWGKKSCTPLVGREGLFFPFHQASWDDAFSLFFSVIFWTR